MSLFDNGLDNFFNIFDFSLKFNFLVLVEIIFINGSFYLNADSKQNNLILNISSNLSALNYFYK